MEVWVVVVWFFGDVVVDDVVDCFWVFFLDVGDVG